MRLWQRQQDKSHPLRQRWMKLASGSFWLEAVMLPLGMLALQALPLSAWLQLGAAWVTKDAAQALLPTWALLLILLVAFWLARWLTGPSAPGRWAFFFVWICGLTTLLLAWYLRFYTSSGPFWQFSWLGAVWQDVQGDSGSVAGVIGILLLLALLWWRGLRLGRNQIEFEQVARSFKVGFAGLVVPLLLLGTVDSVARVGLGVRLGLTLVFFLFAGLAALSLARLAEIRRVRRVRGNAQADPTRSWVIAMLALSGALVLALLGIEQAFSYQTWLAVVSVLQPVWDAISTVADWIALGLGFVIYWVLYPLVQLAQALFGSGQNSNSSPPSPPNHLLPASGNNGGLPTEWLAIGRWILICIGIALLLVILLRVFRGVAARRRSHDANEERENLRAAGILRAQLRALLARLATRFQRKPSAEAEELDRAAGSSVRRLYRQVLLQAQARGLGRHSPETPDEFARRLGPALTKQPAPSMPLPAGLVGKAPTAPQLPNSSPAPDPDLEALTSAYEQARYGDQDPPPAQLPKLTSNAEHLLTRLAERQGGTPARKEPASR